MDMLDAIYKRKSVRKYSSENLPVPLLDKIRSMIAVPDKLYDNIDLRIHLMQDSKRVQKVMKGIVGNFGKIFAPHYLIVTSEEAEGYLENAGFATEGLVLALASLGIATCWMGAHFKDEDVRDALDIPSGQKHVVAVSFGYAQDGSFVRERPADARRKDITQFTEGSTDDIWLKIMDAVRMAPSAANSQPWRFVFEDRTVHAYCMEPANFMMRKLLGTINMVDMGIALRHVKTAAECFSRKVGFVRMQAPEIKGSVYITSIIEC